MNKIEIGESERPVRPNILVKIFTVGPRLVYARCEDRPICCKADLS